MLRRTHVAIQCGMLACVTGCSSQTGKVWDICGKLLEGRGGEVGGGKIPFLYCFCSCLCAQVCEWNGQVPPEQLSFFFNPAILPLLIWPCSCYPKDTSTVWFLSHKCTEAQLRSRLQSLCTVLRVLSFPWSQDFTPSLSSSIFLWAFSFSYTFGFRLSLLFDLFFLPPHCPWGPGSCYLNVLLQETLEEGDGLKEKRKNEREMKWGGGGEWKQENRRLIFRMMGYPLAVVREVLGWNYAERQIQTAEGNINLTTL